MMKCGEVQSYLKKKSKMLMFFSKAWQLNASLGLEI